MTAPAAQLKQPTPSQLRVLEKSRSVKSKTYESSQPCFDTDTDTCTHEIGAMKDRVGEKCNCGAVKSRTQELQGTPSMYSPEEKRSPW